MLLRKLPSLKLSFILTKFEGRDCIGDDIDIINKRDINQIGPWQWGLTPQVLEFVVSTKHVYNIRLTNVSVVFAQLSYQGNTKNKLYVNEYPRTIKTQVDCRQ